MTTTATYAPVPSAIPAPSRSTDVFDFLHTADTPQAVEESVEVYESTTNGLVAVTLKRPDGRSISRKVPADCWREQNYRSALIRSLALLVA